MLAAFLARDPQVAAWLGATTGVEDPTAAAARFLADPCATWDRPALAAILAEAVAEAGGDAAARAAAATLGRPDAVAVVTGQQPAVGGGPLYTLVKTAHAIAIAERLRTAGRPAVPVFWCASEDHDLGEAGHADLIGDDGRIHRVRHAFAALAGARPSLRFQRATAWWEALLAACRTHLGPGLGTAFLEATAPHADEGMGRWLCRLLGALFAGNGLVCVEGHRLRPLWPAALERARSAWPRDALARRRQEVLAAGHPDAFGLLEHAPLFADLADGRRPVDPAQARGLPLADLSPGAALRPVLQQAALPAAFYVAGPGELAYHAFLGPLYAALGVPRPQLVPRCSAILVPGAVRRALERWGVAPDQLGPTTPAPPAPPPLAPLAGPLARLASAIAELADHPPLPGDLGRRLDAGLARLRRDQERLLVSLARGQRQQLDLPPFATLRDRLWPRGQPQERVMSLIQAVWQQGPGVAERLLEAARSAAPGECRLIIGG